MNGLVHLQAIEQAVIVTVMSPGITKNDVTLGRNLRNTGGETLPKNSQKQAELDIKTAFLGGKCSIFVENKLCIICVNERNEFMYVFLVFISDAR